MNALNSGYQAQGNVVAEVATIKIDVRCAVAYQPVTACQIADVAVVVGVGACSFGTR